MMFSIIKWFNSLFKNKKVEEPKKQASKRHYITRHGQKRFEERHGIVFTNKMAKSIVKDILNKKSKFVRKTCKGTEEWVSGCNNKKYRVIFDPIDKIIITVFPGIKKKKRKPSRKKKVRNINGRKVERIKMRASHDYHKRNKKVEYKGAV